MLCLIEIRLPLEPSFLSPNLWTKNERQPNAESVPKTVFPKQANLRVDCLACHFQDKGVVQRLRSRDQLTPGRSALTGKAKTPSAAVVAEGVPAVVVQPKAGPLKRSTWPHGLGAMKHCEPPLCEG